MSDPRVAEATDSDIDAIASFFWDGWRQAGPEAPGWAGAADDVMEELTRPEVLRARIGGPDRRMWLAWDADRVIGFAATRRIDEVVAELAGIVVLQDQLGGGVGTALLQTVLSAATDDGYRQMVVRTEADNDRAAGFYVSHGFVAGGIVEDVVEGRALRVLELSRDLGA